MVGDLSKLDERALAALHRHPNEWFVRQARRVLADRAARGEPLHETKKALRTLFDEDPDPVRKLRGLWSLYVIGAADDRLRSDACWITSTNRCAPGRSGCSPTIGRSTPSSAIGSDRMSNLLPTCSPNSTAMARDDPRAWCGWCWPRRCNGCR